MNGIQIFRNLKFVAICVLIMNWENRCFAQRMYAMRWVITIVVMQIEIM